MRVRFLLHTVYGTAGGVVTVTLRLAEDLARRGHDVDLVSLLRHDDAPRHSVPDNVRLVHLLDLRPGRGGALPAVRRWAAGRRTLLVPRGEPRFSQYGLHTDLALLRYLRSLHDGVLVTMQPGMTVAMARLGRREPLRVAQDHRPFGDRPRDIHAAYARFAHRLDAFLTLTGRDARRYRRLLGGGVLVDAMTNGTPEYDGPPSTLENPVVVAAGRLERTKGFDLLLEAWAEVAPRHPGWELRIFGRGSQRDALLRQMEDLRLTGSVRLMGFSDELHREMAQASVFVLSSRTEGYGMVLAEAMACGVPVVSFDCRNGPRDIIDHGRDGLLVPPRDVAGLASALNRMIDLGPEGRRPMAEAALASARRRAQPVVTQRWEELFERLAARRRGAAR